ncbi:hypothetical protein Emag_003828 [Eimeria magna]
MLQQEQRLLLQQQQRKTAANDVPVCLFLRFPEDLQFRVTVAKTRHAGWELRTAFIGNVSRFLNHSCDPNVRVATVWRGPCLPLVGVFALKDIPAGAALTYAYGPGYEEMLCLCGAANCEGFIGGGAGDAGDKGLPICSQHLLLLLLRRHLKTFDDFFSLSHVVRPLHMLCLLFFTTCLLERLRCVCRSQCLSEPRERLRHGRWRETDSATAVAARRDGGRQPPEEETARRSDHTGLHYLAREAPRCSPWADFHASTLLFATWGPPHLVPSASAASSLLSHCGIRQRRLSEEVEALQTSRLRTPPMASAEAPPPTRDIAGMHRPLGILGGAPLARTADHLVLSGPEIPVMMRGAEAAAKGSIRESRHDEGRRDTSKDEATPKDPRRATPRVL